MSSHFRQAFHGIVNFFSKNDGKGLQNTQLALDPAQNPFELATNPLPESSSVPPGNTGPQPYVLPKNILAFRLVTKTLAMIPQTERFIAVDYLRDSRSHWTEHERQEVKISDAFTHIAVAEHDVVAIATNHSSALLTLYEGSSNPTLNIMACANISSDVDDSMEATPNVPPGLFERVWNVIFAKNAQDGDRPQEFPTIIVPEPPSDFSNFESLNAYMKNLEDNWQEPNLPTHLWTLGKLLASNADPLQDQLKRLYIYTLAMCCRKMNRRLTSPQSQPYLRALKQVKEFPFKDRPVQETSTSAKSSREVQHENEGINNDRGLLEDFVLLTVSNPNILSIELPNMINVAHAMPRDASAFELYTSATCMEVHQLLLELLKHFGDAVHRLSTMSQIAIKNPDDLNASAFKQDLNVGRVYGYALMRMARGRAFQMHMENIEDLLDAEMEEPEDDDEDEELKAIQVEKSKGRLSKAYNAWLHLMVVHLDAVEILVGFVNGSKFPYQSISIKMLVAPTTSREVLSWPELFNDAKLFPIKDTNPLITTSNDEIKKFLEDAIEDAKFTTYSYRHAQKAMESWEQGSYQKTHYHLGQLNSIISSSPTTDEIKDFDTLRSSVLKAKKSRNDPRNKIIRDKIYAMCSSIPPPPPGSSFYLEFDRKDSFSGTLHCEAYLGSLLDNFTNHFPISSTHVHKDTLQAMKGYGRVIGVSKRCCPVCFNFLNSGWVPNRKPFLVRGSHSNITGCTLPPWTPSSIMDAMLDTFANRLRNDLIARMPVNNSGPFRSRAQSAGSQTLSLESTEGPRKTKQSLTSAFETNIVSS